MALKDDLIQSAVQKVKNFASGVSSKLSDQQGWFRGGQFTPVQQIRDIQASSPVQSFGPITLPNFKNQQTKQFYGQFSTPEGQAKFNETPVINPIQGIGSYIGNRYIAPITQIPYNLKQTFGKDKSLKERGFGALGLLSGVASTVPDPIQDIAMPAYDYLKGTRAAQLRGEGTLQSYKTGLTALTGQKPVGLGEAVTINPTAQTALNIAELPIMLGVTGKVNKYKTTREAILGSEKQIRQLSNTVKLSDNGVVDIDKNAIHYAEVFIDRFLPNLKKSSQLRAIKQNDPRDWVRTVTPFIEDALVNAKDPRLNVGFNTKSLRRLSEEKPVKTGVGTKVSEGIDTQYRSSSPQTEILVPKVQTEKPITNKSLQTNAPLSLPQGDNTRIGLPQGELPVTEVRTSKQMANILRENPNARVTVRLPDGKTSIAYNEGVPIIVRNKSQLKTILREYPNANVRIELKPKKGQIATLGQVPDRADVASTIPSRIDNFIQDTLGYTTQTPAGGTREAGTYTKILRKGVEKVSTAVEQGMASENAIIRTAATTLQNFFRGIGMSPERASASAQLRGSLSTANERAYNVMETLYQSLNHDKKSLERINAVLDPEISKLKLTLKDLTPQEQKVYGLIREGLDIVHDQSYANGHISPELYVRNKGKYTPRLYDVTELPPEVNKFVTQSGKKIDNNLYKQRGATTDWKVENSLNDPVYALGKRLAQVETNSAIKKYTEFLSSNPNLVSDVERAGFVKLSDSPAYGALSGKWVLNSAAEDLKGFFFSNQTMQNVYDIFRAYDRMPIRQLQKKLLTVFNPTTNVGNVVSDQVFGFMAGVDPITLNSNLIKLKNNPSEFKQLSDYLMRQGINGTDITRSDFVSKLGKIDELASGKQPGRLAQVSEKVQAFYGGTDDAYKVSALKSLLDKGFTLEEATRKVADGFQNYSNVGKYYDLWSKTPIIGKPFVKFQGDLVRIIKNAAVNNPLGLITFLGTLQGISLLSSKLSGETPEDYKTRTERFAAPMIPGLNIPLTWQTPIGEINVARYISPFFANNETTNIASNMIPFVPDIQPNKDLASNVAMNVNDPLLSPLVQLGINRDFRGKPISDPTETKYSQSTLTPAEKLTNQAMFAGRSYLPPPINSLIDVGKVAKTGENMYGSPQTVPQSIARLAGIKVSDMSPSVVQGIREKDAQYAQKGNEFINQQINSVTKQQLKGEITPEQAQARIDNLNSQIKQVDTSLLSGAGDKVPYINDNGNLATLDLNKLDEIAKLPSSNRYEKAIKESKQYQEAAKILDNNALTKEQRSAAIDRLGIDPDKAEYYRIANDNTNAKTMFVLDALDRAKTNGIDPLRLLQGQRTQINGQMIASNAVLDNLVDEGILSYAQAKELKKYKFENGQLVKMGKAKVARGKKIKIPKLKKIKVKAVKVKKLKKLKFKPVKLAKPKKIKVRRLANT